jgi:NADPH:quinone reductase-like Zn-dependent oxidoreductase
VKAIRQRGYGSPERVLRLEEVGAPDAADDEVLVRVRAASINSVDCRKVRADPILVRLMMGLRTPNQPAIVADAAGVVEAVGPAVTELRVGDEVYGHAVGALGELVAGKTFVAKPARLTFEQAAALPTAASTALEAVRDNGVVSPGAGVLVNGAGGGVGTFAVQIARALGAQVTAVTAPDKVELVGSLGAVEVLDRTREDFTRRSGAFDLIVDIGGDHSLGSTLRALKPDGRLVMVGAHKHVLRRIGTGSLRRRLFKQRLFFFTAHVGIQELRALNEMIEAGQLMPVIDRTYGFDEAASALAYAESQQAAGKVVVTISGSADSTRDP